MDRSCAGNLETGVLGPHARGFHNIRRHTFEKTHKVQVDGPGQRRNPTPSA